MNYVKPSTTRGKTEITVIHGDILTAKTQAIVCPADPSLGPGIGLSGKILTSGGEHIFKQAKLLVEQYTRMNKSDRLIVPVGSAHITTGGALCDYIIHVVGTDVNGVDPDFKTIEDATLSSLVVADKNRIRSVAFPLLGTMFGDLNHKAVLGAMFGIVDRFVSKSETSLEEVYMYMNGRANYPLVQFLQMIGFDSRN